MIRRLVLLVVAAFIAGCNDPADSRYSRSFELDESTFDSNTMQIIKDDTGLAIPEGSRGLNFLYKPPVDPAFLARIEIPTASKEFIKKELEKLKEREIGVRGGLTSKASWWTPQSGKVILNRQVFDETRGTNFHGILTSEDGKIILYIDYST